MKTYYIADEYQGQRTGTYQEIKLSKKEITMDRFGNKTYNGKYLYESLYSVLRAIQS